MKCSRAAKTDVPAAALLTLLFCIKQADALFWGMEPIRRTTYHYHTQKLEAGTPLYSLKGPFDNAVVQVQCNESGCASYVQANPLDVGKV